MIWRRVKSDAVDVLATEPGPSAAVALKINALPDGAVNLKL